MKKWSYWTTLAVLLMASLAFYRDIGMTSLFLVGLGVSGVLLLLVLITRAQRMKTVASYFNMLLAISLVVIHLWFRYLAHRV